MHAEFRNEQTRITWVDQAKGIAMILVLYAHAPNIGGKYIYAFHIPFFFYLSGYTFNAEKYSKFRALIISKFNALIKPYILYSMIGVIYFSALSIIKRMHHGSNYNNDFSPVKAIYGSLLGIRDTSHYNGTLWFITTLLSVFICWQIFSTFLRQKYAMLIFTLLAGFAAIIIVSNHKQLQNAPFNLDVALVMLFFFALGVFVRSNSINFGRSIAISALLIFACCSSFNSRVDAYYYQFGNPILYFAHSVAGIVIAVFLIKKLPSIHAIERIGKSTLPILALHQCYIFAWISMVFFRIGIRPPFNEISRAMVGILMTILSISILLPFCSLAEIHFPILLGRQKTNNT